MTRFSSLFLSLAIFANIAGGQVRKDVVVVFEIPSEVETYIPVTAADIEERAFKVVYLKNERQAAETLALIRDGNEAVDPEMIRIKITGNDESYVFDKRGIGVSAKGKSVKIDLKDLTAVLSR